eukprot:gnl/Trimastix_PCT/4092.p1 GENE.gnl/Trimastix_PCT/4092~~gnl/Trimastix_PCT/4092.p1  ORF type:complete len:517 (+),score=73.34 gnl/Trimastix_PCT/4092:43-1593(+)
MDTDDTRAFCTSRLAELLGFPGVDALSQTVLAMDSDEEMSSYLKNLLGDTPQSNEFISELILRRQQNRERQRPAQCRSARPNVPSPPHPKPVKGHRNQKRRPALSSVAPEPPRSTRLGQPTVRVYHKAKQEDFVYCAPSDKPKGKKTRARSASPPPRAPCLQAPLRPTPLPAPNTQTVTQPAQAARAEVKSKGKGKKIALHQAAQDLATMGHDLMVPGRQRCECQARRHPLINNCVTCGRVICAQEGAGPCMHCGTFVRSNNMNRARNAPQTQPTPTPTQTPPALLPKASTNGPVSLQDIQREQLHENALRADQEMERERHMMEQREQMARRDAVRRERDEEEIAGASQEDQALRKAIAFKDRLLKYDATHEERTKVIDDQADYFEYDMSIWSTPEERQRAMARKREMERRKEENKYLVSFDLAGRRVYHTDLNEGDRAQLPLMNAQKTHFVSAMKSKPERWQGKDFEPNFVVPKGSIFDPSQRVAPSRETMQSAPPKVRILKRVQDEQLYAPPPF